VQQSSDPAFEAPALQAVRRWRFEPGKRNGQSVAFKMRAPITFKAR
jgi:protein TonB